MKCQKSKKQNKCIFWLLISAYLKAKSEVFGFTRENTLATTMDNSQLWYSPLQVVNKSLYQYVLISSAVSVIAHKLKLKLWRKWFKKIFLFCVFLALYKIVYFNSHSRKMTGCFKSLTVFAFLCALYTNAEVEDKKITSARIEVSVFT